MTSRSQRLRHRGFAAGQGLRRRAEASPQGRGFAAGQGLRRRARASPQGRGFAARQGLRRRAGASPQGLRRRGFAAGASPQGLRRKAGASPQGRGFAAEQGLRRRSGASPQGQGRRGFAAGQGLRRKAGASPLGQRLRRRAGASPQVRGFAAGQAASPQGLRRTRFYVLFCYHRTFGASEIRRMRYVFNVLNKTFPSIRNMCLDILSTICECRACYFVGVACNDSPKNVSGRLVKEPCTWCLQNECQPARALQRSSHCFWCDICCSKQIIKQSGNIATVWEATRSRSPRCLAAMPQKRYRLDFSFAGLQRV